MKTLKVNHYYVLISYAGGVQYQKDIGKVFKVNGEAGGYGGYYKTDLFAQIGKTSVFMENGVFKEVSKEETPEYFL